jgi:2-polyprenyl-3-methyl-5-hydroxy-6-metoxy-1,4-benzoquinol methylase
MMAIDEWDYTEEQRQSLEHFNEYSHYWYDIYQDDRSFTGYALRKQQHAVLDLIDQTEGVRRILDVGCGAGAAALELAHKGYDVSGIDIAPNMIQRAANEAGRQGLRCDFRVGIAEKLPYGEKEYDVLIALGLLGNILHDKPVLHEMARVLKPGGRLIVTIPNLLALDLWLALPKSLPIMLGATELRRPLRIVGNIGRRLIRRAIKPVSTLRFNQCVIPQRYASYLQQYGFRNVRYSAVTFGPLMPFGLHVASDQPAIRISEMLAYWAQKHSTFNCLGTIVVFDAWCR